MFDNLRSGITLLQKNLNRFDFLNFEILDWDKEVDRLNSIKRQQEKFRNFKGKLNE